MSRAFRAIVTVIALFTSFDGGLCWADTSLPKEVAARMQQLGIPLSAMSLVVRRVDHPETVVFSLNPRVSLNPASVMKLVTTFAALEILGPTYTWKTRYFIDGTLRDGELKGNLVLKGGGDPYLTSERFLHQLNALRSRGLRKIDGDLIIDDSDFAVDHADRRRFDGQGDRVYNVIPNASLVNFSATRIQLVPQDDRLRIVVDPPATNLKIVNEIEATGGPCRGRWKGWSFRLERTKRETQLDFYGSYPRNCGEIEFTRAFLPNRDYTYGVFRTYWEEFGGSLEGSVRNAEAPPSAKLFLEIESRPLTDVITGTNKFSNNIMARQLLLTIGKHLYGAPGTPANGIKGIRQWLRSDRVEMPDLVMENGSGLSRIARVSAASLSNLLQKAWESDYRPEFLSSLSLAGIDGTMRRRLKKEAPAGKVRIKTGLLNQTRAMAGYVRGPGAKEYSVAMLMNHRKVNYWSGNQVQDVLLRWLMHH